MASNNNDLLLKFMSRSGRRKKPGKSPLPRQHTNVKPGFVPVDQGYAPDKMVTTNPLYQFGGGKKGRITSTRPTGGRNPRYRPRKQARY